MQVCGHLERPRPCAHISGILNVAIHQALVMLKRSRPLCFIFTDCLIEDPSSGFFDEDQAFTGETVDPDCNLLDLDARQLLSKFRIAEDLARLGLDLFVDCLLDRGEGHGGQVGPGEGARGRGRAGQGGGRAEIKCVQPVCFVFASAAIARASCQGTGR